ncbi:hypothetical protein BX616_007016 [Lobosporangium transversale]|nr:hypothetical protein BX616_007016 [Lobosporangium transversale]
MVASPDELLLAKLQQQSSWIDPNAAELSLEWQQRAKQVFTPFADGSDLGNITQIHAGQNMCFLSKVGFVKFFMPSHDGHTSFVSEVKANQILLASAEQKVQDCAYLLSIPRMLKYGYFLDAQQVKISDWRWPYIITEVENPSKTNIPSAVPLKSTPAASLVSASDFMPEDESGYEILLSPILNSLRYLHTLDRALLEKLPDLQPYDSTRRSTSYLANCLESATLNHLRWRVFPKHLLELLPKYLPKDAAEVFDPITYGHITATLIHGDINPSNILGYLDEDGNEDEDEVRDRDEPDEVKEHEAQAYGRAPLFRPTSLIDFGDAVFESDPLIDIISVFITIVDCQQDKKLCSRLLDYWRELTKSSSYSGSAGTKLARRCMWHVLLWPGDGLSTHLVRCMPEIGTMLTWEQVEEEVFGWWKDAHVEG